YFVTASDIFNIFLNLHHLILLLWSSSHTNAATLRQLILNGVVSDSNSGLLIPKINKRTAPHVQMILPRNESPDFPSHPSINLEHQRYNPTGLILGQRNSIVRRHRHRVSVHIRRPDVYFLVALISSRQRSAVGDLLVTISSIEVELIVVDADFVIRVTGRDGDLKAGGEEVGIGDVEDVNGGVLEDELRLSGTKNGPNKKNSDESDEEEDEDASDDFAEDYTAFVAMMAAVFG
ncbi:hypothetical protein OWV82_022168, partial [Melia azedarach]